MLVSPRLEGVSGIFVPNDEICTVNVSRFLHSVDPPTTTKVDRRGRGLQPSIDAHGLCLWNKIGDGHCPGKTSIRALSSNCEKASVSAMHLLCCCASSLKHIAF